MRENDVYKCIYKLHFFIDIKHLTNYVEYVMMMMKLQIECDDECDVIMPN